MEPLQTFKKLESAFRFCSNAIYLVPGTLTMTRIKAFFALLSFSLTAMANSQTVRFDWEQAHSLPVTGVWEQMSDAGISGDGHIAVVGYRPSADGKTDGLLVIYPSDLSTPVSLLQSKTVAGTHVSVHLTNVAADPNGGWVVLGEFDVPSQGVHRLLLRYADNGTLTSSTEYESTAVRNLGGSLVRVDSAGNVYTADHRFLDGGIRLNSYAIVRKFSPTGTLLWWYTINDVPRHDQVDGLEPDGAGGAFIVSGAEQLDGYYAIVARHLTAGGIAWTRNLGINQAFGDAALTVAANGSPIILASHDDNMTIQGRCYLASLDPATGIPNWINWNGSDYKYSGTFPKVQASGDGSLYVAGFGDAYYTAKFDSITGTRLWSRYTYPQGSNLSGQVHDLAIDNLGNSFLGGSYDIGESVSYDIQISPSGSVLNQSMYQPGGYTYTQKVFAFGGNVYYVGSSVILAGGTLRDLYVKRLAVQ